MSPLFAADTIVNARYKDGGPIYTESDFARSIVEPFNAASAMLFIIIPLFWLWRLRGRYREHVFLTCCMPVLLTGGIGGTLYHALRTSRWFFRMDVMPIQFLGLGVSFFFCYLLNATVRQFIGVLLVILFAGAGVGAALNLGTVEISTHVRIMTSYALLGTLVIGPLLLVLKRTRGVHGGWIALGAISFGIALCFRYVDVQRPPVLPMGTHWLWHTFGAVTTFALSEYVYRLTRDKLLTRSTES